MFYKEGDSQMAFTFNIARHIGTIANRTDSNGAVWTRELNLVSYNGREPKLDIREWNEDHTVMSKGITLTDGEAEILARFLDDYTEGRK